MTVEITVPDLGDGIDSGDVLSILVKEGDDIVVEQGVVELETDKAVAEIPSTTAGKVVKIHVAAGQSVAIGQSLITLEPSGAAAPPPPAKPAEPSGATGPERQSTSERETKPIPLAPRAPAEPPAPAAPSVAAPAVAQPTASAPSAEAPSVKRAAGSAAPASPSIRRFAREVGIDLNQVPGTGSGGRIIREDVLRAVRAAAAQKIAPAASTAPASEKVETPGEADSDDWGPIRIDRVSKIRATIAANMVHSKATAPHVTNFDDANITELEKIRQSSKKDYASSGIKLTSMAFVMKAVALALRRHPVVNATIDLEARQITYKQYINLGVAVDTERGLMVPVIRTVDTMGIPQIAWALSAVAKKARDNKITIEEMRGGTFTISNLGAIGGTYSTPVINPPEAAILLVGRSREMPVVVDGGVKVRLMMPLSLSYDHRLVDGAAAARFLNEVKGFLEAPGRLLLAP